MTTRARLSAFDLACVVVGGIVGVGIFFTPAEVARRVDNPAQLMTAWILGGVVAALGALVFAELACRLPGHGGTWRYVHRAFGPRLALLFAWANGFVIQAGALGVIGLVLAEHLEILLGRDASGAGPERLAVACVAVGLLAALNACGLRAGRATQNLFTVAKALALAGLVLLAVTAAIARPADGDAKPRDETSRTTDHGTAQKPASDGPSGTATTGRASPDEPHAPAMDRADGEPATTLSPSGDIASPATDNATGDTATSRDAPAPRAPRGWLAALAAAMLPVLFAIGGWQQGTFVAGAARDPLRDVPLGLLGGVGFVIVAYLAVNGALLALLGIDGMAASQAVATDAARLGLARWGAGDAAARVLAGAVVVSSLGILNTICLAPPYVLSSMAEEGLLPRALAAGTGAPVVAIVVQAGAGIALLLGVGAAHHGNPIEVLGSLLDGVVFVDWLFYGLCGLALLRLQRRGRGEARAGFRAPGGALVPGAFAAAAAAVAVGAIAISPVASLTGAAICALGLALQRLLPAPAPGTGG